MRVGGGRGEEKQEGYQLEGYRGTFASEGPGKGIGLYVREGTLRGSRHTFSLPHMQIVTICLTGLDIISVYRSKEEPFQSVVTQLQQRISKDVDTLIVGDLNYCYSGENDLSRYMACHYCGYRVIFLKLTK